MNLKAKRTSKTTNEVQEVTILDFITVRDEFNRDIIHAVYSDKAGYIHDAPIQQFWIGA